MLNEKEIQEKRRQQMENITKGFVSIDTSTTLNNHLNSVGLRNITLNEIEKGGEGSRGGRVIGHTKSGKPIYSTYNHSNHSTFNKQDHLDAADIHKQKFISAKIDDKKEDETKHRQAYNYHTKESEKDVDIQKSHITDLFGNNSTSTPVKKKGKEIKEKLEKVKLYEEQEVANYLAKIEACLAELQIDECPDKEVSEYTSKGLYLGYLPKQFSWECMAKYDDILMSIKPMNQADTLSINNTHYTGDYSNCQTIEKKTKRDMMRKYNDLVEKYVEERVEVAIVNTLLNTIDDNATYTLSPLQATSIGF